MPAKPKGGPALPAKVKQAVLAFGDEVNVALLNDLINNPGDRTATASSARLGYPRSTVRRAAGQLIEAGVLIQEKAPEPLSPNSRPLTVNHRRIQQLMGALESFIAQSE